MKAWQIEGEFGLDNLNLVERERPTPGRGEILIAIEAVSLNYRDRLMVDGLYNPRQPLPLVPCSDAAGRVEAVGDGVREWQEGDRVCTQMTPGWLAGAPRYDTIRATLGGPLDGTLQEAMVQPANAVVRCPEHLSSVEGSTLPVAAVTAWNALVTHGGLTAGGTALMLGTGGVSVFGLQLTNLLGGRAIITSSSDEKLARARELGAWQTINYKDEPDWGKKARELTGGTGVDVVVEVGGAVTLPQSVRATRLGGTIALIGIVAGGGKGTVDLVPVFMSQMRLQGILVGHRESFETMNRAIEVGGMKPVVDRVFGFDEAPDAFRHLAGGGHFGKVCISLA